MANRAVLLLLGPAILLFVPRHPQPPFTGSVALGR